jgi:hypothetical protein
MVRVSCCVLAGFMTENEMAVFEKIRTRYNKYFIPFVWATALVARARKEGRISYDGAANQMMKVPNYHIVTRVSVQLKY